LPSSPDEQIASSVTCGTAQIALVTILLAGLLVRSYINVTSVQPGFSSSTMTFDIALDSRYAGRGQGRAFLHRLLDRIALVPGVQAAGAVTVLPFSNSLV
jgi:hypothetical protein